MTTKKSKTSPVAPDPEEGRKLATQIAVSSVRHGLALHTLTKPIMGGSSKMDFMDCAEALNARAEKLASGNPEYLGRMLAIQATTLDAIFTEMTRRMALNMGEYLGATQTYANIALKAQAGSRAALAEIVKLHQPREQTVRHVHVNEGGQAVIADEFHNHTGGQENGQGDEQPHATGTAGQGSALSGPDPLGPAVPIPGGEGAPAMQDARRERKRRTRG